MKPWESIIVSENLSWSQFDKLILLYRICSDVLFKTSEYTLVKKRYIDQDLNKYFEVYNPTSDTIDLSQYAYPQVIQV